MKRFIVALLMSVLISGPAQAFTANSGMFTSLEYVADTEITAPSGAPLSLCHQTSDLRILGYTMSSSIVGYVLAIDQCAGEAERPFSPQQMETAQSLNLIDASLPSEARNSMQRTIQNYGIWVALGLALFAVILRRLKSLMGLDPSSPMRKKATQRILTAMCYMAKCDGIVASNEITLITKAASRLTRQNIQSTEVVRISDHIDMDLTPQDFLDFGKGLRDAEKDTMMRGAFFVGLASGRIIPPEYDFLTNLAHGIGMPGEDFRRVMSLSLEDLDIYQPTL
ncbi:TerB family tellurite resistance protein [Yoonia sp. GPGPB17]|uniref:tellurite resistance TerB family protein n=1 Tax=Yoonia sp. GPGPB17 TaxID=3026147 RepID=UPI0030BDBAC3